MAAKSHQTAAKWRVTFHLKAACHTLPQIGYIQKVPYDLRKKETIYKDAYNLKVNHKELIIEKHQLSENADLLLKLINYKNLTVLDINSNAKKLGEEGEKTLSGVLCELPNIKILNLKDNNFGYTPNDDQPVHFCSLLKSLATLTQLTTLDLSGNYLNSASINLFIKTLDQLKNLENLILQNTQIDYKSADSILTQTQHMPSLTRINLLRNNIFDKYYDQQTIQLEAIKLLRKAVKVRLNNGKISLISTQVDLDYSNIL